MSTRGNDKRGGRLNDHGADRVALIGIAEAPLTPAPCPLLVPVFLLKLRATTAATKKRPLAKDCGRLRL